jgi:hypothetical protein
MIKIADKKDSPVPPHNASYEESIQPSLGITFCRKDGSQRYAPYSFLSTVEFAANGELIFRFTSWSATVRGETLQPLWKAVRTACLLEVCESRHASDSITPTVREIIFAHCNFDSDAPPESQ